MAQPMLSMFIPVAQLRVPREWHVAGVTLHPPGVLETRVATATVPPTAQGRSWHEMALARARSVESSTAEVPIPLGDDRGETWRSARERVRDVVALLRLYQRARHPLLSLERQTFGFEDELGNAVEEHWVIAQGALRSVGANRLGSVAWEFPIDDVDAFPGDPRFQVLERALTIPTSHGARLLAGLRAHHLATLPQRPQVAVALLATTMEAMFGDDVSRDRGHRIAQLASYLTCGRSIAVKVQWPDDPHRADGRLSCAYLQSAGSEDLERRLSWLENRGVNRGCTWFDEYRELFRARNDALHRGRDDFTNDEVTTCVIWVRDAFLAWLEWAAKRPDPDGASLRAELAALPADPELAGPERVSARRSIDGKRRDRLRGVRDR